MKQQTDNNLRNYRPKWHYTPPSGWINDPNGLVYVDGIYHLFAQHHPYSTVWGPMHWAHAISRDLISWEHLPVALVPDELGAIFSGGAVYDHENTSGFAAADSTEKPIVLMFCHSGAVQQQSIAWSTDHVVFHKYSGNPVIPTYGIKDFRDPKPFPNPVLGGWSSVVAAGDHVDFYRSSDMKTWEKTGVFGPEGNRLPGVWECPDLFPLQLADGSDKWVLILSMGRSKEAGGPCTQYFIGSFDGLTFTPDQMDAETLLLDPGFDNYAAISFDNAPDRILIGWGCSWVYAHETPTGAFRGAMTLPRNVTLADTPQGLRLACLPCASLTDRLKTIGSTTTCMPVSEETFGLFIKSDGPFTIRLENDNGEQLRFGLNAVNEFFIDRSVSGDHQFSDWYDRPEYQVVRQERIKGGPISMQAYFDVSMLELFADDGLFACNSVVYPTSPYTRLTISGPAVVDYQVDPN
ncbi:MAG: glycoside hydrolase family 32 protein [Bacillota bacterium]|nr:glycoside hydrolase family 32 protein [Bacillota bacterium]